MHNSEWCVRTSAHKEFSILSLANELRGTGVDWVEIWLWVWFWLFLKISYKILLKETAEMSETLTCPLHIAASEVTKMEAITASPRQRSSALAIVSSFE